MVAVDGGILIASVAGVMLVFILPLVGAADAALRTDLDWTRIDRNKTRWVLLQVFVFPFAVYYFSVVRPELKKSVSERRRTQTVYRPPRSRRELGTAIACAAAVIIGTSVLVWVLRPQGDDAPTTPEIPPELTGDIPTEIPPELTTPPGETVPVDTAPVPLPEETAPVPAP
jgi:hypothetical protein